MLGVDFNLYEQEKTASSVTETYQAKSTSEVVTTIEDIAKKECRSMNVENILSREEMETFDDVETELEIERMKSELEFFEAKTDANSNIDFGVADVGDGSSKLEEGVWDIGDMLKGWNNAVMEYWGLWLIMFALLWLVWRLMTYMGEYE